MKKRILSGLLCGMMLLSLAGCGSKKETVQETGYASYMTLGQYKGHEVTVTTSLEVTDAEIQEEIDYTLEMYAETNQIKEGTVKDGDTINMDYSGLLDGVAFANGTATDTTYTVGGNFIEDLDRALVGLEIGKEYEIPCTFPADYQEETLAGKDVIFVVTVNYVEETVIPEYTDEFVKKITADSDEVLNTTAEMTESIKTYLAESKQETYNQEIYSYAMQAVVEASEVKSLPQEEVDAALALLDASAQSDFETYGPMFGTSTFEEFIVATGYESMEAYNAEMLVYAEDYIKEKMAVSLIAEAEGIVVTDEDVTAFIEDLSVSSGYETVEEFKTAYGETLEEDARYELLYQGVYDVIIQNTVVK